MAKILQNSENQIKYRKYFIDSSKFYIDSTCFINVNIPQNFTLIDSDTGAALNDFKRNSLEIPYKDHKIYIASLKKQLKQISIDRVLIYFPAKIAGADYFSGIRKEHVIEVLNFLSAIGYVAFESAEKIYKQIYVKDLDIKMDMKLAEADREDLKEYNKQLEYRFQGTPENWHPFNSIKQGYGIQTYKREISTFTKPFLKFYDKTKEMQAPKNQAFFASLPDDLQAEIRNNFIYRYEFTLKDKTFFSKFGISNRLEDVHEIRQEKWHEIGSYYVNTNFQAKIKVPRDLRKLKPIEKTLCLHFLDAHEHGLDINQIRNMYIAPQSDKKSRYRMSLLFDRIYQQTATDNVIFIRNKYDMITKWDKFFGFIKCDKKQLKTI